MPVTGRIFLWRRMMVATVRCRNGLPAERAAPRRKEHDRPEKAPPRRRQRRPSRLTNASLFPTRQLVLSCTGKAGTRRQKHMRNRRRLTILVALHTLRASSCFLRLPSSVPGLVVTSERASAAPRDGTFHNSILNSTEPRTGPASGLPLGSHGYREQHRHFAPLPTAAPDVERFARITTTPRDRGSAFDPCVQLAAEPAHGPGLESRLARSGTVGSSVHTRRHSIGDLPPIDVAHLS